MEFFTILEIADFTASQNQLMGQNLEMIMKAHYFNYYTFLVRPSAWLCLSVRLFHLASDS